MASASGDEVALNVVGLPAAWSVVPVVWDELPDVCVDPTVVWLEMPIACVEIPAGGVAVPIVWVEVPIA